MNYFKSKRIQSKKITNHAKGQRCTLRVCSCSSKETVVFCHAPSALKGMGIKTDDFFGAFGCYNCHVYADSNKIKAKDWLRAIYETQKILFSDGIIKVSN